jgi:hypothetical protein
MRALNCIISILGIGIVGSISIASARSIGKPNTKIIDHEWETTYTYIVGLKGFDGGMFISLLTVTLFC